MCFQALSQCPVVDILIFNIENMSFKHVQEQVQLFQQFCLCGLELFFHCDFRYFAIGVILVFLIHNYPLDIRHVTLCIVQCRDWARKVFALRTFSIHALSVFCVTCNLFHKVFQIDSADYFQEVQFLHKKAQILMHLAHARVAVTQSRMNNPKWSEHAKKRVRDGALFFSHKLSVQIFNGVQKKPFLLLVFLLSEGLPLPSCDTTHIIP